MVGIVRQMPVAVVKRHGFDTPIKEITKNNFEATRKVSLRILKTRKLVLLFFSGTR